MPPLPSASAGTFTSTCPDLVANPRDDRDMGTHGTLTDNTSEQLSFALAVDFYDPEGFRFTQAHVTVTDLPPGATEEWGSWLSRGSVTVDSDGSGSWDQAERDAAGEGFTCVVT